MYSWYFAQAVSYHCGRKNLHFLIAIQNIYRPLYDGLCTRLTMRTPTDLGHNDDLKPPNMQARCPQHQPKDIPNHRCFLSCSRNTTVESRSSSLWNIWTPRLLALLPCRSCSLLNKIVEPSSLWVPCSDTADYLRGPGCLDPFCCAGGTMAVVCVGDDPRSLDL